jgi:hypothetical protein
VHAASFQEIEELVDGVRSFDDLAELFKKRHAEELQILQRWTQNQLVCIWLCEQHALEHGFVW